MTSKRFAPPLEFKTIICSACRRTMYLDNKNNYRCDCGWVLVWDPLELIPDTPQIIEPLQLINRLTDIFDLSKITQDRAKWLFSIAKDHRLHVGKHPYSIPTAAVYIAVVVGQERVTQQQLAKTVHLSDLTLRNGKKGLIHLLPDNWKESFRYQVGKRSGIWKGTKRTTFQSQEVIT